MRTFHEGEEGQQGPEPIRVSYHGRSHYNAVIGANWDPQNDKLIKTEPGQIEAQAL